jgi:hypothetical protein
MSMLWLKTDKGDPDALWLVDHGPDDVPHYTAQTKGRRQFTRNGQNLVFITADRLAVWATHRPAPGKAKRPDGRDSWECTVFRNCGPIRSALLIREAEALTWALWVGAYGSPLPSDGLITFIQPDKIRSAGDPDQVPGYCYRRERWWGDGAGSKGWPRLRARAPREVLDHRLWDWKPGRGGKMRTELEGPGWMAAGKARGKTRRVAQVALDFTARAA